MRSAVAPVRSPVMIQTHLVYLSGPPGAGKSTLMAQLTGDCWREPAPTGIPHDVLWCEPPGGAPRKVALEIGAQREDFSGTDALSMSIQPKAVQWLGTHPHDLVLGEGDRLANMKFLTAVESLGVAVTLVALTVSDELLERRWAAERAHQNPTWRAGRVTKARRLAESWRLCGGEVVSLDVSHDAPDQLAAELTSRVPVLRRLP